jgi:hypothetical protein
MAPRKPAAKKTRAPIQKAAATKGHDNAVKTVEAKPAIPAQAKADAVAKPRRKKPAKRPAHLAAAPAQEATPAAAEVAPPESADGDASPPPAQAGGPAVMDEKGG